MRITDLHIETFSVTDTNFGMGTGGLTSIVDDPHHLSELLFTVTFFGNVGGQKGFITLQKRSILSIISRSERIPHVCSYWLFAK